MKKFFATAALCLLAVLTVSAQAGNKSREAACKENYRALFGGEALTGEGTDPEMMAILQKFIFGEVFRSGSLDMKTREMITCVSLAAQQALPQLEAHAAAALRVGVTPVELREAMYLTAPYVGFPKMLNAVATVNKVMQAQGVALPLPPQATVGEATRHSAGAAVQDSLYPGGIAAVMSGVPGGLGQDVERFLTDYFFGDIYTRSGLSLKQRELLGYCVLTTIGADSQLQSHYHGALRAGNRPEEVAAAVVQCLPYVGFPAAIKALRVIRQKATAVPAADNLVRLSRISVDRDSLAAYNAFLKEEIEASMAREPGVLVLYATADKKDPTQVTILEIYADRAAYEAHLKTPHFQKYKQGTLAMVKDLQLIDTQPLIPGLKMK